jgi:hypothetical protein
LLEKGLLVGALVALVGASVSPVAPFDTSVEALVIDAAPFDIVATVYETAAGAFEASVHPLEDLAAPFDTSVEVVVIKAGALVVAAGAFEIENASEIEKSLEIGKLLEIAHRTAILDK